MFPCPSNLQQPAIEKPHRSTVANLSADTLARISLYLLSSPSPAFTSLIKPLLTPETIPNTIVVVLLDWLNPQAWLRQLQEWILMLRDILQSLDVSCMTAMEEVMISWRDRGRNGSSVNLDGTGAVSGEGDTALPLGPSEWEDGLGLPLCVVCQNVSTGADTRVYPRIADQFYRPIGWRSWRRARAGKRRILTR